MSVPFSTRYRLIGPAVAGLTTLDFPFPASDADELQVRMQRAGLWTILAFGADWTVAFTPSPGVGGIVTLTTPAQDGDNFVVMGAMPPERAANLTDTTKFQTGPLNREFDRIWMSVQEVMRDVAGFTDRFDALDAGVALATAAQTATAADRVATAADRVQTGLDRTQTGTDAATTGSNVALAQDARIATEAAAATAVAAGALRFGSELMLTQVDDAQLVVEDANNDVVLLVNEAGSLIAEHINVAGMSGRAVEEMRAPKLRSLWPVLLPVAPDGCEIITGPNQPVVRGQRVRAISPSTGLWAEGRVCRHLGGCVVVYFDSGNVVVPTTVSDLVLQIIPPGSVTGVGDPPQHLAATYYLDTSTGRKWMRAGNRWWPLDPSPVAVYGDWYVSNVTSYGLQAGVPGNLGTRTSPFATIAEALAAMTSGQSIVINGNYNIIGAITPDKSVTLISAGPLSGKLTRTANVRVADLTASMSGKRIDFIDVDIDGGGYSANLIGVDDTASIITLGLYGGRIRNWLGRVVSATGTATKLDFTMSDYDWLADGMVGGVKIDKWAAGTYRIYPGYAELRNMTSSSEAVFWAKASTINVTAPLIVDPTLLATAPNDASLNYCSGLISLNFPSGNLWGGQFQTTAPAGSSRNGTPLWIGADEAAPLSAANWRKTGHECINGCPGGGYTEKIGPEDVTAGADGYQNGHVSRWAILRGIAPAIGSNIHGMFAGGNSNALWQYCWVENVGFGPTFKDTNGAKAQYSVFVDMQIDAIRTKGVTADEVFRCTFYQSAAVGANASLYRITGSDVVAGRNTGTLTINECLFVADREYAFGGVVASLLNLTGAQNAVRTRNVYAIRKGLQATRFSYGNGGSNVVNYDTADDWCTAQEPTSVCIDNPGFAGDPMFVSAERRDFRLVGRSRADNIGTTVSAFTYDFAGQAIVLPTAAGAFGRAA